MICSLVIHTEGEFVRRAPERSVGSLAALMEHAGRETRASSPRVIGQLACGSHGARRSMGDFYPIFEHVDSSDGYLQKERTLCRAGAGRAIPASDRRPTGFAGNPRGVYLRLSEPVFGYGRRGKFSLSWSKPVASRF